MEFFRRFFTGLGIYRNVKHGWITGLCAGGADRIGVKPLWVRIVVAGITIVAHFIAPIIIYLVLAFLVKPRDSEAGAASPAGVQMAYRDLAETVIAPLGPHPGGHVNGLKARFAALDMRLNHLEATVMTDELSLRRKFKDIGG